MGVSPEVVAAWLSASCAEQGVPVLITDPHVLADVAVLLSGRGVPGSARSLGKARPAWVSDLPDGSDPAGVEGSAALLPGVDDGVVEDR
jgi:hypothetical protein